MIHKLINNIENHIETCKQKRRANRRDSLLFGQRLVKETKADFESLASQLSDKHSDFKRVANSLATEILQCGIDYFKANMESNENPRAGAMELLRSAGQIALSPQIRERVDDNVQGIEDWSMRQALKDEQNVIYDFNKIKLQTAFSFMTCDGDIDKSEVELIRTMANDKGIFGEIDINTELDFLVEIINQKGKGYLKDYFKVIKNFELRDEQEIQLAQIAVNTLLADAVIDYNELRFFRIFRSLLSVSDQELMIKVPNIPDEFLESDIFTNSYLKGLFDDYFDHVKIPTFEKIGIETSSEYGSASDYLREH